MTFDFDGRKYSRASTHQKEWGARLIAELNLRGDEQILDLGCGDGVLTARLAELVPQGRVVGVDASPGMIGVAESRATGNVSFILMDINHWTLEDRFDVIYSNATLHWILDHSRLLSNIYAQLNEAGIARFNFGGMGNCPNFDRIVKGVMTQDRFAARFDGFVWPWFMPSQDEYEALVSDVPFRKAQVWDENADRRFPDADSLVGWIDQPCLVPFVRQINGSERTRFRNAVVEQMLSETSQGDGTYLEEFRRINLLATR